MVHYCTTQNDLDFILKNGSAPPYIPIIPTQLYTLTNVEKMKNSNKISGLLLYVDGSKLQYYTHENQCPNPSSSLKDTCQEPHIWNPYGTGLLYHDIPFPVFYIEDEFHLKTVKECFVKHNNHSFATQRDRSLCALQLNSFMYGTTSTPTCLRRTKAATATNLNPVKFCDPLGDQNIWASLFPLVNSSRPIRNVVLATHLDTTSLFDQTAGAANPISGLVTLLATAKLLKTMLPTENKQKPYNIFFVVFNGETYDYIGSQRFVYDLNLGEFSSKMPPFSLNDIDLFVELSQLSQSGVLAAHYLQNGRLQTFLDKIKLNGNGSVNFRESSGTLPPASLHTFLKNNSGIPGVLLTDHTNSYVNKYYNSLYDNATNLKYQYLNLTDDNGKFDNIQGYLVNVTNVIAKSLYHELENVEYTGGAAPDVIFIDELLHCYLEDPNCRVHQAVQKNVSWEFLVLSSFYV